MSGNKTSKAQRGEKKILLLSVILGMSANALLSSVFSSVIPFSIFPLIALVLSAQMLYQYYLLNPVAEEIPLIGLACFFIGAFGHAAFLKSHYPEMGSNFFSILVCLVLLFWVGKKLGYLTKRKEK